MNYPFLYSYLRQMYFELFTTPLDTKHSNRLQFQVDGINVILIGKKEKAAK